MSRKPQRITRRAQGYAYGVRYRFAPYKVPPELIASAWEDGYRAALREVRTKLHEHLADLDSIQRDAALAGESLQALQVLLK